jgi:hypothetical protein
MAISVGDLGPVGLMKAIVNTFLAMAAVGIVLTWPEEFGTAKSLTELGVGLFFVCGAIEWAGGKDMSDRNARRLDRRWTGVDPDTRSRQEASLQQRARDDAGDGKKRDEVVRRQKLAKEEHAALDVVGLVAPEARFAAEAVKTGQKSFDALRAHQDRKRKGAAKPPEAAKDNRPYASDQSKAV